MIYTWYADYIRNYESLHVVQFLTYQVVADDFELHVNWLMAGCFGNWQIQ